MACSHFGSSRLSLSILQPLQPPAAPAEPGAMAVQAWVDDLVVHVQTDPEASPERLKEQFLEFAKFLVKRDPALLEDLQLLKLLLTFEVGRVLKEHGRYLEIEGFFSMTQAAPGVDTYLRNLVKTIDEVLKVVATWPKPAVDSAGEPVDPAGEPASSSAGPVADPAIQPEPEPSAPKKARRGSGLEQDLVS